MWLVLHLLERPLALAEALRVVRPDGRLVVAAMSDHRSISSATWLNRFFPSLEAIDRARFPSLRHFGKSSSPPVSPRCG